MRATNAKAVVRKVYAAWVKVSGETEGYAGGYRDALSDVLLLFNGVQPKRWLVIRRAQETMHRYSE